MSKPLETFSKAARRGERFRRQCESLIQSDQLGVSYADYIYEVIFLSIFVAFEEFLEGLFIELMCGRHIPRNCTFKRRVEFVSPSVARENLYAGRSYVDLLPFDNALRKAEIFFRGGRPFSELQAPEKRDLSFAYAIRNCVAHKSRASIKSFREQLGKRHALPPADQTPARYLRSGFSARQTRFEAEVGNLIFIARKLDGS